MSGERPARVPDKEIEKLMRRHDEHGLIRLPTKFKENDPVRFRDGVFQDRTGIYQGMTSSGRNKVLLEFLGGETTVLVETEQLELV